jgi:polysaccharide biosynthesis transport protein
MNNNRPVEVPAGLSLDDVYYIIFRHKWKIIFCALAGIAAAVAIHFLEPPLYQSQAELLIKYVPESTQLNLGGNDQKVMIPDSEGEGIINAEIQILTSLDVAEEAASNIGPARILAKVGGGNNSSYAAHYIRANLEAEPADGNHSSVIVVTFKHRDPQIVQAVLREVINDYFQKHYEIHSAAGQFDDALTMEQSTLNVQLNATEQQIADLKNKANIISLDDSQKSLADQIAKVRGDIMDAQAEYSGDEAAMRQTGTNPPVESPTPTPQAVIPQNQIQAYADICTILDGFRKKEEGYLTQGFTRSNSLVQEVDQQIASAEKIKDGIEKKYPQISDVAVSPISNGTAGVTAMSPQMQIAKIASLRAKIKAWNEQLAQLQTQATNLNNLAPSMAQLEQTEAIEEANYKNLSVSLENSHIDEALDTGKSPNIKWVQTPSPPFQDWKKTQKFMAMAMFGGVFGGLAWAFLIEMFLDRTIKRPAEVEAKLKLPLFLSIPDVNRNGHTRRAKAMERRQLQFKGAGEAAAVTGNGGSASGKHDSLQVVSLELNHSLEPFYEALRNRLILYFEIKNLTHKPKLVAVTGAGPGAGVSSIAAGLAASLSETGDGNVLLVDMNLENGAAQQFYKGKACCGLDAALQSETKGDALVQENLYVVNGNANGNGLSHALPKRFAALMPKLKASDFDYIIFDMPSVSATSITSHLARFMDVTMLVVESEKTNREAVQQANILLTESGGRVGVVLNKTRRYIPARLHQESLNDQ